MNRLALVLAALLASSVVACAAESTDETVATPAVAEEAPTSDGEAKPHSAPARSEAPAAREGEVADTNEDGAFAARRIGGKLAIPVPMPKPGIEIDAPEMQ